MVATISSDTHPPCRAEGRDAIVSQLTEIRKPV
jgi:hypothetical protein